MNKTITKNNDTNKECFAIMPISDPDGYTDGHFSRVYSDIIKPACENAGFNACRADDAKASNLIHIEILKKLLDAPLAICDLSSRNPNVLFELGIRQAFDKPVVLIQEIGTPKIFDISPLRYLEYSRDMKYREVIETQKLLTETINETIAKSRDSSGINSIVKLLALGAAAKIPELSHDKEFLALNSIWSEIKEIRKTLDKDEYEKRYNSRKSTNFLNEIIELDKIVNQTMDIEIVPTEAKIKRFEFLLNEAKSLRKKILSPNEANILDSLINKIYDNIRIQL